MAKKICPVCKGNKCRVAANGKSGFCKTQGKWRRKMVKIKDLQPGPIQHKNLHPLEQDLTAWSYAVVGRWQCPTLEQWELGFMRDIHKGQEIIGWHRIACAFITYHRRLRLPLRSAAEERRLVGLLVDAGSVGFPPVTDKDVVECMDAPEGWENEVQRINECLRATPARWTPSPQFADWPSR
jgi:hypothetical protein